MPYPEEAIGFQVDSAETYHDFHKRPFKLKNFADNDIDVKIDACGVCASDLHAISGGWGEMPFPLAVGHEVIGKAVKVGPAVKDVKVGDRVGVGAQSFSCGKCRQCTHDNENYCQVKMIDTWGSQWPKEDGGVVSQGGWASHIRTDAHWVFPIPEKLETNNAAPMLCAGITVYSPLVRNGCGPGKKVGIVGMGGIGHYGVIFAKALGAETWAISRSHSKEADMRKLGADGFIATQDKDWEVPHKMTFDLIVNTANGSDGFDLGKYLSLLDVHGHFVSVGLPEDSGSQIHAKDLISNGVLMGASHIGNRRETIEMLQLAADKGLKSMVQEIPISAAGLKEAVTKLKKHDVRYRFTMTEYDKAFPDV